MGTSEELLKLPQQPPVLKTERKHNRKELSHKELELGSDKKAKLKIAGVYLQTGPQSGTSAAKHNRRSISLTKGLFGTPPH